MRRIGELLKATASLLGGLGLLTTVVSQATQIGERLQEQFWLLLATAWLLLAAGLWPPRARRAGVAIGSGSLQTSFRRYFGVGAITLVAIAIGGWRLWDIRRSGPPVEYANPIQKVTAEPQEASLVDRPTAASVPVLAQFRLDTTQSSYRSRRTDYPLKGVEVLNLHVPGQVTEEEVDDRWSKFHPEGTAPNVEFILAYGLQSRCRAFVRRNPPTAALVRFLHISGRVAFIKYVEAGLESLPLRRQDVIGAILPRDQEWTSIRNAGDEEAIRGWISNCVGFPFPVVAATLTNPADQTAVLTAVRYWVIETRHECSDVSRPELLWPALTLRHGIVPRYESGEESEWIPYPHPSMALKRYMRERENHPNTLVPPPLEYPLSPAIAVAPHGAVSLQLMWYLDGRRDKCNCQGGPHEVLMSVEFVTSAGDVRSSEFVWNAGKVLGRDHWQ